MAVLPPQMQPLSSPPPPPPPEFASSFKSPGLKKRPTVNQVKKSQQRRRSFDTEDDMYSGEYSMALTDFISSYYTITILEGMLGKKLKKDNFT